MVCGLGLLRRISGCSGLLRWFCINNFGRIKNRTLFHHSSVDAAEGSLLVSRCHIHR